MPVSVFLGVPENPPHEPPGSSNEAFPRGSAGAVKFCFTGSGFIANFSWVNNERLMAWEGVKSGIQEIPFLTGNIVAVNWNGKKKMVVKNITLI